MMQPLNITLPDAIAKALNAYMSDQQTPVEAIVETALLEFFIQHGYLTIPTELEEPLPSAPESFRQGWHDAMTGNTIPIAVGVFSFSPWLSGHVWHGHVERQGKK